MGACVAKQHNDAQNNHDNDIKNGEQDFELRHLSNDEYDQKKQEYIHHTEQVSDV